MAKLNKKVLKYGTASVVLAVVFVALVFAVNLIAGIITEKFNLYVDLTSEQLYSVSDNSFELLSDMDEDVKIIFFTPLDQLDNNSYYKNVKNLALEYEEKFDNITIEYIDMTRNPELVRTYRTGIDNFSEKSIVVESNKRFTSFTLDECFVYTQNDDGSYSPYAFNAEYRFTSSLMKVTRDTMPQVSFVTNHAEEVPTVFKSIFEDSGFEVTAIDLLQEEIPQNCEILIMVSPQNDITGIETEEEGRSEVTKLTSYLAGGGDMMVFVDPNTPELKNLDELLYSWGIDVLHGGIVQDDKNSYSAANNMAVFTNYISTNEDTLPLHEKLSSASNPARVVSYYTSPISIVDPTDVNRGAAPILVSHTSAYVPLNANENLIENKQIPLMAAGYSRTYNKEMSETETNYLIVGGSTYFVSNQFLYTLADNFANAELVKNMISAMTDEKIVLDIQYKVYNDTSLVIDPASRNSIAGGLILILPAIVLAIAMGVFLRRRHL